MSLSLFRPQKQSTIEQHCIFAQCSIGSGCRSLRFPCVSNTAKQTVGFPLPRNILSFQWQILEKTIIQGKKKHININKFAGLSRDWVGAKNLFMCFFRVIPYGGEKTHKQSPPPKSRDNPVKILFTCFFLCVFFRSQIMSSCVSECSSVIPS